MRYSMHLQLIIVTRSPNLCASSATPTSWCNSTRRKRIRGELSWSATKILWALSKRPEIFARFLLNFEIFIQSFIEIPNINLHRKTVNESHVNPWGKRTDMTMLTGAFRIYAREKSLNIGNKYEYEP